VRPPRRAFSVLPQSVLASVKQGFCFGVVALVAACGGNGSPVQPSSSAALVIHNTLNASGATSNADGAASERSGGFDRQTFDDFVSPATASIRTIRWQGIRAVAQPVTSFFIAFVADNGNGFPLQQPDEANTGRPRAMYIVTAPVTVTNERVDITLTCANSPQQQCGLYDYSLTLTQPFAANAGVRYWLLIQAETPSTAFAGWQWRRGTPDNQRAGTNIANTIHNFDLAFALQ
jgi:hypothetical protein